MIVLEDFEEALLGVGECVDIDSPVMVYDYSKCLEVLMKKNDWSIEDAIEWMDYNVISARMGKASPVFVFPTKDLAELAMDHDVKITEKDVLH